MIRKYVAIIALAGMISGCASTSHYGGHISSHSSRVNKYNIECQQDYSQKIKRSSKSGSIDDLFKNINTFSRDSGKSKESAICKKQSDRKYRTMLHEIDMLVTNQKYSHVKSKIKSAVIALQEEDKIIKNKYINVFKQYTYTRIDYVSPVYEEKQMPDVGGIAAGLITLPFAAVFSIAGTLLGQDEQVDDNINQVKGLFKGSRKRRKIKDGYYKEYKITSYYNKKVLQ